MQIASFREEISNTDVRCVASSRLRKKTGGFTSFTFTEFRIAQRRTSSNVPKPACIQMVDFRNIKHQHADTLELLDPAPELVERCSAHHASRAVHDRRILQAFDLKFEFHMSIHTNLLRKKFRDRLSLY
jgi:hypothetical protein